MKLLYFRHNSCQLERRENIEDVLIIALQEDEEKIPNVEKQKIDDLNPTPRLKTVHEVDVMWIDMTKNL